MKVGFAIMTPRGLSLSLFAVVTVMAAAGCSYAPNPSPPNAKTTYPIKGQVFIDDKPGYGVTVRFNPKKEDVKNYTVTQGLVDQEGNFVITTYKTGDGAPEGEYTLTFTQRDMVNVRLFEREPPDLLGGKYADPRTSEFVITVEPSDEVVNIGRIDLSMEGVTGPKKSRD